SFLVKPEQDLPQASTLKHAAPGTKSIRYSNIDLFATTMTTASYKGMEGELPFRFVGKSNMLFADLKTAGAAFGTIDYSETPPLLFVGEWVEYDDLKLKNVRQFEGWS